MQKAAVQEKSWSQEYTQKVNAFLACMNPGFDLQNYIKNKTKKRRVWLHKIGPIKILSWARE